MSTIRRLFEHPLNTEIHNGRPVQVCCDGNKPYWDTYRIHDDEDAWDDADRNMTAYKFSDSILVEDATGASDNNVNVPEFDANGKQTGSNDVYKGMVRVEGPNSGYRPDFLTPEQWMAWQGVYWGNDPRGVKLADGTYSKTLPNPMRWRRTEIRTDKMRWGKGIRGWGGNDWVFLWCQKCESALEAAWSNTLDVLPMVSKGIAMIVSYVPVFGTAIAYVLTAGTALAEGKPLDEAMLEATGAALPGQPVSGMAFNAGVAIAQGKPIDGIAIATLPIPSEVKALLIVASDIVKGIASGENVSDVMYEELRKQIPPEAEQAMAVAKRLAKGEHVPTIALDTAEKAVLEAVQRQARDLIEAAKNKGEAALAQARAQAEAAINAYAAQTGYQVALMKLPTWQRDAIQTGLAAGAASRLKVVPMFTSVAEKPEAKATLDALYAKGLAIVQKGAKYQGMLLSDMLSGKQPFSVYVWKLDPMSGAERQVYSHYSTVQKPRLGHEFYIDDAFRRGFLIATGLCEGMGERGPGQLAVYQQLAEHGGRAGFDAGQAVAHWRTNFDIHIRNAVVSTTATQDAGPVAVYHVKPPPSTATIRAGLPSAESLRPAPVAEIAPPRKAPLVIDSKVYAQKTADRARWVEYYKNL